VVIATVTGYLRSVRYVDWVDRVLVALDRAATGDGNVGLIGVAVPRLLEDLSLPFDDEAQRAVRSAADDLELMSCADAEPHRIRVTPQGQLIARAGGLRRGWKSLFETYVPLDEDLLVLAKVVELSVVEADLYASTSWVELKDALRLAGQNADQGTAIATSKRLEAIGCVHRGPITMGPDGYCQVRPSYVAIVITTEQLATEERALLDSLLADWETTSVDVKERLELDTDRQKAEFCKDILALANTRVSGRRFLVLGFNDISREFTTSVVSTVDTHRMESVLSAYCRPVPQVRYSTVALEGGTAGLVEVMSDRASLPYQLARDVWKLKADSAFVRHNTLVVVATGEELATLVAEGERAGLS
jgi:hypothetical protein